jgi:hypothetical protein
MNGKEDTWTRADEACRLPPVSARRFRAPGVRGFRSRLDPFADDEQQPGDV